VQEADSRISPIPVIRGRPDRSAARSNQPKTSEPFVLTSGKSFIAFMADPNQTAPHFAGSTELLPQTYQNIPILFVIVTAIICVFGSDFGGFSRTLLLDSRWSANS
jgi:hypothetical protein